MTSPPITQTFEVALRRRNAPAAASALSAINRVRPTKRTMAAMPTRDAMDAAAPARG